MFRLGKRADLHVHSIHSDGNYNVSELINKASERGIGILSITDHDSLEAYQKSYPEALDLGVDLLRGIEISTGLFDKEIHLLGYFIDPENRALGEALLFFKEARLSRAENIVSNLNKLGLQIGMEDVLKQSNGSPIGRPHIARAMLELGLIGGFYQAFDKYLGDNAPAYVKKALIAPEAAIELIHQAGGLAFLAHPGNIKEETLNSIIGSGIDGIEVIHPSHNHQQQKFYRTIAAEHHLLESGGSDFHGDKKGDEVNLGKYYISSLKVENMKQMLSK